MRYAKLILAVLLGCAAVAGAQTTAPLRVVGYQTKPFLYKDAQGRPAGIEFDILTYAAKSLGRPLAVSFLPSWDDVLPKLLAGGSDVAAASITITPERQAKMDFSASYFPVRVLLVEPKGQHTAKLADLAGSTIATMKGTTYEKALADGLPHATFTYGPDEDALLKLVAGGKARAAAMDSAVALGLLPQYPQLALGMPLSAEQELGFAVRKGDPLAAQLSKVISQLKDSKIYYRILEQHLGKEAARLVAAGKN